MAVKAGSFNSLCLCCSPSSSLLVLASFFAAMAVKKPQTFSLPLSFLMMLLLSFYSGTLKFTNGETQKTWCVAKPSSDDTTLQENIDFACSNLDCSALKEGGMCFDPDNKLNHASVAMNLYYQINDKKTGTCDFKNSGLVMTTDPSYGKCVFFYKPLTDGIHE